MNPAYEPASYRTASRVDLAAPPPLARPSLWRRLVWALERWRLEAAVRFAVGADGVTFTLVLREPFGERTRQARYAREEHDAALEDFVAWCVAYPAGLPLVLGVQDQSNGSPPRHVQLTVPPCLVPVLQRQAALACAIVRRRFRPRTPS